MVTVRVAMVIGLDSIGFPPGSSVYCTLNYIHYSRREFHACINFPLGIVQVVGVV